MYQKLKKVERNPDELYEQLLKEHGEEYVKIEEQKLRHIEELV